MVSFKSTFSLSSFTFMKRLFSSSLLSAIRVVSSAYLRLLIFLPAILIPACASSSPAFLRMYSACKLNKQGDNIQPWRTPFPIWNQARTVVNCNQRTAQGTSLAVQWLVKIAFQCRGFRLDPWSGTYNPTCLRAKRKNKQKQYCNKFNKEFFL